MSEMMCSRTTCWLVTILGMTWLVGCGTTGHLSGVNAGHHEGAASGSFAPVGPPTGPLVKTDAGKSCVVEIQQAYAISGTLSGSLEITYCILVAGPCGSPPGTFDEEWIAHGKFTGEVNGSQADGALSYVATVSAGGKVDGHIVLGQGLEGDLRVHGNFSDGRLSYKGWVEAAPHNKAMQPDGASRRR